MFKVIIWMLIFSVSWRKTANAQQLLTTEKLTDVPSEDFIDRGLDGSYRFGYKNGDKGAHYHNSAASSDNTVSGRFGYRDPATRNIVQTSYSAGQRGFRARGPNIARQMDLSQVKLPYQPPVPENSPNYQPSYDSYHDPNEDPSYDFNFKTPTYSRGENSDVKGNVNGAFSYVDDVGKRHDVQYEAGSKTGFHVKSPSPDSDPFPGVFYQGPNKPGTPARGHTSIVRSNDGAYKFTASGPDQQRTEVSDSSGRVRGSYTYIDDKGVQRNVQYVAGPNIGYKVIRKGTGPVYSSVYPYARPEFISPTLNDAAVPLIDNLSKETSTATSLDQDAFSKDDYNLADKNFDTNNADGLDSPSFPKQESYGPNPEFDNEIPAARKPTYKPYKSQDQSNTQQRNLLPPGAASYLTPANRKNDQSQSPFPDNRPQSAFPEDDVPPFNKGPNYNENAIEGDAFKKPFINPNRAFPNDGNVQNGYEYPKPDQNQFFEGSHHSNKGYSHRVNDNRYSASDEGPGVAIRAHVQSLDILPYGSRIPSPEEALRQRENEGL